MCSLLSVKVLSGVVLLGVSCEYKNQHQASKENERSTKRTVSEIGLKTTSGRGVENKKPTVLSNVERYSLCSNRIV